MPTYTKVHADWQDYPSTTTPILAADLEQMEEGIFQASRAATTTQDGNVELATGAEMTAGTDTARVPSVKTVADYVTAAVGAGGGTLDPDLVTIGALAPANDDFLQRKSGAWANRTVAQVKTDLGINNVDNTSDATKNSATATLSNKTITSDANILTIDTADVTGLDAALGNIASPGLQYVEYNAGWANRSTSGTSDPNRVVLWIGGSSGPVKTGTGATGAVVGDLWIRTV